MNPTTPPGGVERRRVRRWENPLYLYGFLLVLVVVAAWRLEAAVDRATEAAEAAKRTAVQVRTETRERRNETCRLFERSYRAERARLGRTYDYLVATPAEQRGDQLFTTLVALLPSTELEARQSYPPSYCAPGDIGLPGENRPPPCRPDELAAVVPSLPPDCPVRVRSGS